MTSSVGDVIEVAVGAVAHGGHCVARLDGRVVFVRHALPGERVRARITEGGETARYLRADAVKVLEASPHRVPPPCPHARPGGCGGCDWQHVELAEQRRLKAAVVAEQLRRLSGIGREVVVEELPGSPDGLGWRTRVRHAVDAEGRLGFRRHRSHAVEQVEGCPLAHPALGDDAACARTWGGAAEVALAVAPAQALPIAFVDGVAAGKRIRVLEQAAGREWRVTGPGFWQVHPAAADTLAAAVLDALAPQPGEAGLDLYAGVGLFAGVVAQAVGPTGAVVAVESSEPACKDARRNLHDLPQVRIAHARVDAWLRGDEAASLGGVDIVVLDPPRSGAGRAVVEAIAGRAGRAIAYVACDPAALARDLATFAALGWRLDTLRAFDAFPMTHHVECVAGLVRDTVS